MSIKFYLAYLGNILLLLSLFPTVQAQGLPPDSIPYSPPLGHNNEASYWPYQRTGYGGTNSDLPNNDTCFKDDQGTPIKWPNLLHAGEDWFRLDGQKMPQEMK